jgi:NAD(P)H-hydrate epimerase
VTAFNLPAQLPKRPEDSHKGNFGLAVIVGGSRGMAGAPAMAGMAALRGGAGLVRLAVPDVCLDTVAGFEPSYTTVALTSDRAGRIALDAYGQIVAAAAGATVLACGPGMGRSLGLDVLVRRLYAEHAGPMVVDADGLNALSADRDVLARPGGPRVLTPHPGEFARLTRSSMKPDDQHQAALQLAARCGVIVVLKGHRTLVTDGRTEWHNATGNPGMATGGCGDVLTGLITALACQGLSPLNAATLGVCLHGTAGDLAAAELGEVSLVASDLIRFLPQAFQRRREQSGG